MSRGREWFASGGRHLEKNPHTNTFVEFKSIMAKLDVQLSKEAQERKERKEAKKNG